MVYNNSVVSVNVYKHEFKFSLLVNVY